MRDDFTQHSDMIYSLSAFLTLTETAEHLLVKKVNRIMKQKHCARAALAFFEPKRYSVCRKGLQMSDNNSSNTQRSKHFMLGSHWASGVTAVLHCD